MAIPVPVLGEIIDPITYGKAVADAINATTALFSTPGLTSRTLTTAMQALSGAFTLPASPQNRLVVLSASVLFSVSAGQVDLFLTGGITTRRLRSATGAAASMSLSCVDSVPAGEARTYTAQVATVSGSATVSTFGGSDLNYLHALVVGE